MYPVTTTIIQNAVAPHQLGTATGALNFARLLGGAIIVAAFGAIVLGGIDTGGRGLTLEMLRGGAKLAGADFATVFGWLFASAAVFLAAGLIAVLAHRGAAAARAAERARIAPRSRAPLPSRHSCAATRAVEIARPKRDVALQHKNIESPRRTHFAGVRAQDCLSR